MTALTSPSGKSFATILVLIATIFLVTAVVLGVVLLQTRPTLTSVDDASNINGETPPIQIINNQTTPPIMDGDLDGISDAEEQSAGTNPKLADSDADGLNDREERTFGTEPLQPDTDQDGFQDGAEIQNGYNPKGPGQLFNFEQGLKNLNQS